MFEMKGDIEWKNILELVELRGGTWPKSCYGDDT